MSMLPEEILHLICPMHLVLEPTGHIRQAGPTLHKISPDRLEGAHVLEVFEVFRPRAVTTMEQLLQTEGRKIRLRLRGGVKTQLYGILVGDGQGGAVVNLSFGIHVMSAVRDYALTNSDFAATDLAMEMLYLVEAKSAAMDASRSLNTRLQGAMVAAEERAFTDTLTGLRNRRALDAILERFKRSGDPFSLMHIDLDFFKQVNDTLGHAAGDLVLRQVARVMTDVIRKDDTAVRVGGDEFLIVFGGLVQPQRLADIAENLIRRIEEPVSYEGQPCRISASIGISMSDGGPCDPAELLEQADMALYASKRAGRAQFGFFTQAPQAGDPARVAGK
ncbi:GGDEF domain-containing protein [Mameliella sediminis]|uniref:GGDEF domain-containing protein n=1 Tax=Mameliella sediminis TaxID=2836866 RepID=UPI001C496788|nr:GGDEF domain-containing protein [Mameliella sediminis]MBY6112840.1 GGDEF domain-containing protein [Antarctobacter heliothermus]MBY6143812.1 GGDEF domain-containing protein [Mameliella alba]MBV7394122.1 GGDEF domain-containing protein [Mameliella sediminis]MBY6162466.1 GGDEF domain-containing protein [Mameliella alba]MBY6170940.1 GGDEF domain-containing protein [Mameliella alba]